MASIPKKHYCPNLNYNVYKYKIVKYIFCHDLSQNAVDKIAGKKL